jgi:hypothetical protein
MRAKEWDSLGLDLGKGSALDLQRKTGESANDNRSNYQFLSRTFSQGVAITQIVDLKILDVVAIGNIRLARLSIGSSRVFSCWAVGLRQSISY